LRDVIKAIKSRIKLAENLVHIGKMRNEDKVSVGKPEVNKPLRKPRYRWKDNIKIDLKENEMSVRTGLDWTGLDWTGLDCTVLAQNRDGCTLTVAHIALCEHPVSL
jgi:hypothetical protein